MTPQPGRAFDAEDDDTRPLPPGGGRRFRSATGKLVAVALISVVVTAVIAIGGLGADDPAERWLQFIAGGVAAAGAVAMLIGVVCARGSVRGDVLDLAAMRTAGVVLTIAAVLSWFGFGLLWFLGVFDGSASTGIVLAAVLSIPLGSAALIASFVRRIPARVLQAEPYDAPGGLGPEESDRPPGW